MSLYCVWSEKQLLFVESYGVWIGKQPLSLDSYDCYIGKHAAFTSSKLMDILKSATFTSSMLMGIPKSVAGGSSMLMGILRLATFASFMLMDVLKSVAGGGRGSMRWGATKREQGRESVVTLPPAESRWLPSASGCTPDRLTSVIVALGPRITSSGFLHELPVWKPGGRSGDLR